MFSITGKRFLFAGLFSVPVLLFSLAGCVSIPEQPQLVSRADGNRLQLNEAACSDSGARAMPASYVPSIQYPATVALDPDSISIMSWNIYKGSGDNWQHDLERISDQQDVLLLQEALLKDELKAYLKQRGLHWHLNTAFSLNGQQTGVMTAARVRATGHCALRVAEPIIRTPKTTLISRFELAGMQQQLLVANLHGVNFTLGLDAYGRQLQAMEDILGRHRGPIVLAGDFNNWSDGRSRLIKEMVQRLSLEQLPFRNHNRTRVLGSAIDHIFYRGLSVVEHKTHEVTSSDHNPITVSFRVNQGAMRLVRKSI